ncbi:ATP-dependent Clp protease ATP-binding subunit ClpC [Candidatus Gracilibacteria bacterium]|nr:MAG: ATP-dependent Clp protease ATP-binding subunit ClpC [Candidatus Gracilibacteria bacterium]
MSYNNFSNGYKKILLTTEENIQKLGLKYLSVEDIFLSIIREANGTLKDIFSLYGINEKLTLEIINKAIFNEALDKRKGIYSGMNTRLKNVILGSLKIAASYSKTKASIEDFLISMIVNDSWINSFFDYIGITSSDIESNLRELNHSGSVDGEKNNVNAELDMNHESINKLLGALTENIFKGKQDIGTPFDNNIEQKNNPKESTTPALDFFSTNLTSEAREGKIDKIVGRDNEVERLVAILNRKTKNNPVLVGEPGVGKTAIIEGLALKIASGDVPFSMKDKKVLALDMTSLVAGTKYRGEFESRIKQVVEEASKVENEIILFIDEIHTIIGAGGGEGTLDASNILKPAMGRGKIRIIGATTYNEYKKYIEKDSALERRFQQIVVNEPTKETAKTILSGIKSSFEEYHNLIISEEAVNEAVDLSIRYITDRYLPDKAIDLIDEACSLKSMKYNFDETEIKQLKEKIAENNKKIEDFVISQQYKKAFKLKEKQAEIERKIVELKQKFQVPKNKRFSVEAVDVQKVLSIATGIPVSNLGKDETTKIIGLEKKIKTEIIGQNEAVSSIIKSIMRNKAGISNPNRPIGSFLFLGPTGVGKTELVKVLAKYFYDDKDALIKIDMSEYSDKTSVNKLIGASSGYVGYEEGGMLTEKVRKKPYSVILFDEIEKGDFEVYNLLLQILEEGVLTDNKGKKVNFKNTIIIMTSNIGQEEFTKKAAKIGFDVSLDEEEKIINDYNKAAEKIKQNLTDYFSPEFINRIDKIIVFNPLDKNQIKKIINLGLKDLEKRLQSKGYSIKYDLKTVNFILKDVYNPDFGAREVRRYLVDNIEEAVAEKIITNKTKKDFLISITKDKIIIK